jgi:hypothetical protein
MVSTCDSTRRSHLKKNHFGFSSLLLNGNEDYNANNINFLLLITEIKFYVGCFALTSGVVSNSHFSNHNYFINNELLGIVAC